MPRWSGLSCRSRGSPGRGPCLVYPPARASSTGFSLVELMVTLVVLAILLLIGVPTMQTLLLNNRMTSRMNALSASLQLVRAEAIKRNAPVRLLPGQGCRGGGGTASTTGEAPASGGGCDGNWGDGWTAYVDRDGIEGLGVAAEASGEGCHQIDRTSADSYAAGAAAGTTTVDCLLWQEAPLGSVAIHAHAGSDGSATTIISGLEFPSAGTPSCLAATDEATSCYFVFCDSRGAPSARALLLSTSGHVTPANKDPQENPLTCPTAQP